MTIPKLGIAWFNDGRYHSCDTCVDGKIEMDVDVRSLNRQVVWLTNLRAKGKFEAETLLRKYGYLRHTQFFRIAIVQVMKELNCNYNCSIEEKLILLQTVYSKIAKRLYEHYDIDYSRNRDSIIHLINKRFSQSTNQYTLNNSSYHTDLKVAFNDSLQKFQSADLLLDRKIHDLYSITIPRSAHFLALTQCTYPIGTDYRDDQTIVGMIAGKTDNELAKDSTTVNDFLQRIQTTQTGFIKFKLIETDRKYGDSFILGQEIRSHRPRTWATVPEFLFLLNYSKVEVEKVLLTRSGRRDLHPIVDDLTSFKPISWVNGLCNELVMSGFAYHHDSNPSPFSSFYRAYDRIFTGMVVTKLIDAGLRVSGFSIGKIYIIADKDNHDEQVLIRDIAIENNCIPELSLVEMEN